MACDQVSVPGRPAAVADDYPPARRDPAAANVCSGGAHRGFYRGQRDGQTYPLQDDEVWLTWALPKRWAQVANGSPLHELVTVLQVPRTGVRI